MIINLNGSKFFETVPQKPEVIAEAPQKRNLSPVTKTLLHTLNLSLLAKGAATLFASPVAVAAFASSGTVNTAGFMKLIDALIAVMDPVSTCVVVFAGAIWMFGHRTKSIELLIGVAAGTLIICHAHDFVYWLRHIM